MAMVVAPTERPVAAARRIVIGSAASTIQIEPAVVGTARPRTTSPALITEAPGSVAADDVGGIAT